MLLEKITIINAHNNDAKLDNMCFIYGLSLSLLLSFFIKQGMNASIFSIQFYYNKHAWMITGEKYDENVVFGLIFIIFYICTESKVTTIFILDDCNLVSIY